MYDFFENEDIVASLNKTNESIIKRLEKELVEKESELRSKDAELKRLKQLVKEQQSR